MDSEPMLTPREKSPLPEKFSSEDEQTHNVASGRTVRPKHYQWVIPAPYSFLQFLIPGFIDLYKVAQGSM